MTTKKLPLPKEDGNSSYYPLQDDYQLCIANSIDDIQSLWTPLQPKDNVFLQYEYLYALEKHPPANMGFRYLIFLKGKQPIGLAYVQTYHVRMEDSVQKQAAAKGLWAKFKHRIQKWFIKKAVFNVMICGNLILTGEHGFYFQQTDDQLAAVLLEKGIALLQKVEEKATKKSMHIQLFKDYKSNKQQDKSLSEALQAGRYHKYTIQPCMYMRLPKEWQSFDDYLEAMSSKYRVRARRAAKKGAELIKKELSLQEIEEHSDEIYALYKNIANSVGFNAYTFHKEYFLALKKQLGKQFKMVGLFHEGQLIAFFTAIFNGKEMEAHFLGPNYQYNKSHQVYLNILYALIQMGIYHQMDKIDFARTALEIKSSVGAVPQEMHCYMRHRNRLSSRLIKFVFEKLSPEEKWTARSPFKDMSIVQ